MVSNGLTVVLQIVDYLGGNVGLLGIGEIGVSGLVSGDYELTVKYSC